MWGGGVDESKVTVIIVTPVLRKWWKGDADDAGADVLQMPDS